MNATKTQAPGAQNCHCSAEQITVSTGYQLADFRIVNSTVVSTSQSIPERNKFMYTTKLFVIILAVSLCSLLVPTVTYAASTGDGTNGDPVATLDDVQKAVVQIEAVGTFRDFGEDAQLTFYGQGSGFMIDPSGIAITNNHVVAGGAYFNVWVAGEANPRNAKVIGVSECADLAVIDIEGAGFPYLDWYDAPIKTGLEVYTFGFPLGDPEITMTNGIVAKAKAAGNTDWASVEQVLQHTAAINPGNSGGPLVDANGHVVGINYAGNGYNQYFAIAGRGALPTIEQLRTGIDTDTIGINGKAFTVDEGEFSGTWVASVVTGSLADGTGLKPGDIILKLEGIALAEDGTMATYCDILRSHNADDVMAIEVLRLDTNELLTGQLNGRPLQHAVWLTDDAEATPTPALDATLTPTPTPTPFPVPTPTVPAIPTADTAYRTIVDKQHLFSVDVPTAWQDLQEGAWEFDGEVVGGQFVIAPDVDRFLNSWAMPGVILSVSTAVANRLDAADLLDSLDYATSCTYGSRTAYADDRFTGLYDSWTDCGAVKSREYVIVLKSRADDYTFCINGTVITDADWEALDHMIESFTLQRSLPTATPNPPTPNSPKLASVATATSTPAPTPSR